MRTKMKNISILLMFWMIASSIVAQERLDKSIYKYQIISGADTIEFIHISQDHNQIKPVLVVFPGSLPIPLLYEEVDGSFTCLPLGNVDIEKIKEDFHLVVISQPHTPLIVSDIDLLNKNYAYIVDPQKEHSYDISYLKDNYLDKYVSRGNSLIDFLLKQNWVNKDHISLFGHSQGARIALGVAKENKHVFAIACFSASPAGRASEMVTKEINLAKMGLQTMEEAYEKINGFYRWWKGVCKIDENKEDLKSINGDPAKTWKSFSYPTWNDLINLQIPIYIAYGTADISSSGYEMMPIYFDLTDKTDYVVRPYIDRGHNFEKVVNGESDFDDMMWQEAMQEFIEWLNSLTKKLENK